ncbi:MAG: hypothetical protein IKD95_00770, partial [Bacteroidales bacterium]|nr:hypothetical protein [Bacteroidales bacterium]
YWRQQRLANKIYYSVSTTKEVDFNLLYNGHQLYHTADAASAALQPGYDVTQDENALQITSTVTLASSFDYWDSRNECPGIYALNHTSDWSKGDIFCAENDDPDNGNSGMDFALGSSEMGDASVMAIEITKYLVDGSGDLITPNQEIDRVFHVYRKGIDKNADPNPIDEVKGMDVDAYDGSDPSYADYTHLHDKHVSVGDGGMGIVYDYDMADGMIYVEEDRSDDSFYEPITDINGKEWYYQGTYLETEYVWRGDGIENRRHVSRTFTSEDEAYNSIPDVLGAYRDVDGIDRYNGFLEFYVYNVDDTEPTEIVVEKVWKHQSGSAATAPEGASVTVTLGRFKLAEDPDKPVTGGIKINQTVNNLPNDATFQATYNIRRNGIIVKSVGYDPAVGGAVVSGLPAGEYTVEVSSSVEGYDVTNTPETQNVTVVAGQTKDANFTANVKQKEVAKTVTVRVTNSINGNPNYQDATYTFPAGAQIAVNFSRPGAGHNDSFHVIIWVNGEQQTYNPPQTPAGGNAYEGITQTLVFQLPQEGDYNIDIFHDWGRENLWINSVSLYASSNGQAGQAGQAASGGAVRRKAQNNAPSLLGSDPEMPATISLDATADYENADMRPESPILGMVYVVDESWSTEAEPYTVVLSGSTWRRVVEDLELQDEQGNKYVYFIKSVHEEGVPEGTTLTIDTKDGKILTSLSEQPLTATNRVPNEPPTVTIRKVDEKTKEVLSGAIFTIREANGLFLQPDGTLSEVVATFTTDAEGEIRVSSVTDGIYTLHESKAPEGYDLAEDITFTVKDAKMLVNGGIVEVIMVNDPKIEIPPKPPVPPTAAR